MPRRTLLSALAALAILPAQARPQQPGYDIVIRGGRVLDGAGNPWIAADLAIRDGRIVRIGQVGGEGRREIDAAGLYVSPGFIDMMDQSGSVLPRNGLAENKLRTGVTTAIGGEGGTPVGVETQARVAVLGNADRAPTGPELDEMRDIMARAMRQGVMGMTTALIYPPSSFASTDELVEMAKVAGAHGGIYASHIRDEGKGLVSAVREAIEIGERAGLPVEIFHYKGAYEPGWGALIKDAAREVDAARARGVDVAADMYPYTAGGTGLEATIPSWVFDGGTDSVRARIGREEVRARLKEQLVTGYEGWWNIVEAAGGWDLARVRDGATYDQPVLFPEGIEYVLVNGEVVIDEGGRHTGARPGHVLYGPGLETGGSGAERGAEAGSAQDVARVVARLEPEIRRAMLEGNIPSLTVALTDRQGELWSGACGQSNLWARTPASTNTVYLIGSTFKAQSTVALLRQMEQEYIQSDVWGALGMTLAAFNPPREMAERLAVPYMPDGNSGRNVPAERLEANVWPAGIVYGTVHDQAAWVRFNLGDGGWGEGRLLQAATLEEMHTLQYEQFAGGPLGGGWGYENPGYGLTWWVSAREGERFFAHSGSVPGYTAFVSGNRTRGLGIAFLTNGNRAHPHLVRLTRLALDLLAAEAGESR